MKIAALQPVSLSDFPQYSAAIIFTVGCNLRCPYCHNKSLWVEEQPLISENQVLRFLRSRLNKLEGVVITGGEPTIQSTLITFAKQIKELGYKLKLNTNGTNPQCLKELITAELLDYVAIDIKAPLLSYTKLFGVKSTIADEIKASIELISTSGIEHEFRTVYDHKLLQPADLELIRSSLPSHSKHILVNLPVK